MPVKYERRPLPVNTGERTTIQLPPRVFRVRLTGLLFETNKTFLLPGAMDGIRGLVDFYGSHPDMGLVVTGHADRVGSAWHNLALSEERAEAMAQFLKDDVEAWVECYRSRPVSSPWGLREDQHMLTAVLDAQGQPFYDGPVQDWLDENTRDATRRFQAEQGLPESGSPDEDTRRALVQAYMSLDGTTLPEAAEVERLGCGENHNAVETADGVDEQENRRVEIFLFDSGKIEPPVPGSCPGPGCAYEHWLEATIETIDFEDALAELLVQVIGHRDNEDLQLLPDADVELVRAGFPSRKAKSDPEGKVRFSDLTSGTWSIYAEKRDFAADTKEIEVHPGGFVVLGAPDDPGPATRSNLVGSPGTSNSVAAGVVLMNLADDRYFVRWVDEPAITPAAQEKAFDWKDDIVHIHPNFPPASGVRDDDEDGLFVLPRGKSTKARIEEVFKRGPHETSVQWRTDVVSEILPGKVVDLKVSSRLRMSIWAFHSLAIKRNAGTDDVVLDEKIINAIGDSHVDDISIVSTIGWVDGSNPPRVDWRDHAPGGEKIRSANYLRRLIDALHAKNIQVQVGWSSVDKGVASSQYNQHWNSFLKSATPDQIQTLAESARDFFIKQNIDIDGIGFDFEVNSMGADQGHNLALLYRKTAEVLRAHKQDAFVTYANAPFTTDGQGRPGFMNIQPFSLCQGVPNLFARPMCFDDKTTISPGEIRGGVECSIRQGGGGGGIHPAQVQFGLYVRELGPGAFEKLVSDTLRPNRIGLILYQLPEVEVIDQIHGVYTTHALTKFLTDCRAWNDLLNPGEALPRTAGQPLQVPRAVDFGI